jgi:hypothetical protein
MNDEELRALIRAAVQRHLGTETPESAFADVQPGELRRDAGGMQVSMAFGQYQLQRAAGDTMCLIEPAVRCNHCGFCKCHGH